MTYTLTIVSHTHWDREWYQPFQEYRIRLVQLTDRLLHLLARDPDYRYFTFDGQTAVLEDYLEIRPQQEATLRHYVQEGRLLIGPWYILPDEFLVGPEATIRNLMLGDKVARRFGAKMPVGYIPDPFGHISQLPQILRGFDLDAAVFWRGAGQAPNEFHWAAPDGSEVLVLHLRDSYSNAAHLPDDKEGFAARLQQIVSSLAPHAATPHLLAMNGTDHQEPMPALPRLIAAADARLPDVEIRHGTLPQFIAAVRAAEPSLELRRGEMRSPERAHLLPGVFSARMWIKQRNARCETLLEKWAEPFSAFAALHGPSPGSGHGPSTGSGHSPSPGSGHGLETPTRDLPALTWQAWRYLIQNHPHDSICGCSVDAVHKEMDVRFDWVEQIGQEVTRQSLAAIAGAVDTMALTGSPVVVFNPLAGPRTDVVTAQVPLPPDTLAVEAVDERGEVVPCQVTGQELAEAEVLELDHSAFMSVLAMAGGGSVQGEGIQAMETSVSGDTASIDVTLAPGSPDAAAVEQGGKAVQALLADGRIQRFRVRLHRQVKLEVCFVAHDVPGHGYRTFALRPASPAASPATPAGGHCIENEFYAVEANPATGSLTVTDKTTGAVLTGLHRFVDGGDRGDEYNYCPPEHDRLVTAPLAPPTVRLVESGPVRWTLEIAQTYRVPASLGTDRAERSENEIEIENEIDLPLTSRVSLSPGVWRIDFLTTVENQARDHRLRVHFPTPIRTGVSHAEGHFDVVTRSLALPRHTEDWPEQPVPTHHQRTFVEVNDGRIGLLVANRGLPEYEVVPGNENGNENENENEGVTVALTLLRCVGWLSRNDLYCRRGHAGPALPTPGAQCLGRHTFEYALLPFYPSAELRAGGAQDRPHDGGWENAYAQAHAFNAPLRAVVAPASDGPLPPSLSFVQADPAEFVLTAVKQAEDGSGLIVRGYNIAGQARQVTLKLHRPFRRARRVNLNEDPQEELAAGGNAVRFAVRAKQIVTILFEM